ncbi:MAG: hypothetical protein SGBAC_000803 [Bacillariaceae sp.]
MAAATTLNHTSRIISISLLQSEVLAFRNTSSRRNHLSFALANRGGAGGAGEGESRLYATPPNDEPENQTPATGWNHKPPKEDSKFWNDNQNINGDSSSPPQEPKKKVRTGWLHNTESPNKTTKKSDPTAAAGKGTGGSTNKAQERLQQAMRLQEQNHRIVAPPTFHACGDGRQVVVTEHRISVPIYRGEEERSPRMDVAFTVVEKVQDLDSQSWFRSLQSSSDWNPFQRASQYVQKASLKDAKDMCLYLQGGPGFGSPPPITGLAFSDGSSWGAKALGTYKRIVLMDQRGTGRSTPITKQTLQQRFPDLFLFDTDNDIDTDDHTTKKGDLESQFVQRPKDHQKFLAGLEQTTRYMAQFRADNIVKDAEAIKEALLVPLEPGSPEPGPRPYGCAIGQSFGGFCMMSYLSLIDHPPTICLLTGGIAPMLTPAFEAYSSLWERVKERSLQYYDMYPGDIPVVKTIVKKLMEAPQKLPSGGTLTARRFLQVGMGLGSSPSAFAGLHNKLANAFVQETGDDQVVVFTKAFLKSFDMDQPFDDYPIYYFLHEAIYADGPENSPTNWAANRAYENKIQTPSDFDYKLTSAMDSDAKPTLFFGEMVFPWMSEDYAECGDVGCQHLANALATKSDWPNLYNGEHMRQVLGDGRSRAAAASYLDDMYVDWECCKKVLSRGGPLEKCKAYVTNEYQHSGLRDDGAKIFAKLHGMAMGSVRTPS